MNIFILKSFRKQVKLEENNFLNISNFGDSDNLLNPIDKSNFIFEENNKTNIKSNLIRDDSSVNPFKIDNDNKMSFAEFNTFKEEMIKVKAQLEILTSNNFAYNPNFPNNNNFQSNPYFNNGYIGNHFRNVNFPQEGESIQSTIFFGNNSHDISHNDDSKLDENENNDLNKFNTINPLHPNNVNSNSNIYNNYYSSNCNPDPKIGFINNLPLMFPFNVQPLLYMNPFIQANNSINLNRNLKKENKDLNLKNYDKDNFENSFDLFTSEPTDTINLDSCISNIDNTRDNNMNNFRNKFVNNNPNIIDASKNNFGLNIPPTVNTFNMVFFNTRINDINLGYHRRNYQRKKIEKVLEEKEQKEEKEEIKDQDILNDKKKTKKNKNKDKKDKEDKEDSYKRIKKKKKIYNKEKKNKDNKGFWAKKYSDIKNKEVGDSISNEICKKEENYI